jgi:lipopolysaccharide transport system permease protein
MKGSLKRNLEIISELTVADFKGKYKNSVLGFFWSFLNPLLMFLVLYVVFTFFIKIKVEHYQLYLLLGIILWTFFSEATIAGTESIVRKRGLITKIAIMPETLVISATLNAVLTFFLNFLIYLVFLAVFRVSLSWEVLYFPVIFGQLFFLILGINFFLSALFVRYQDISHIWQVLLQVWFWLTPIVYPPERIPPSFLKYYMLNPLARLIHSSRTVILYHYLTSLRDLVITVIVTILFFAIGLWFFKKEKNFFPERV